MQFFFGEFFGSFHTPSGKGFVCVVVMMVVVIVTASAVAILVMMVVFPVVVATAATVFVMVMMLLVVVTAAATVFVMVMMLLVVVTAAATVLVVIMVMLVMVILQLLHKGGNGICALHRIGQLLSGQFLPRGGDDSAGGVQFPNTVSGILQLFRSNAGSPGEDDGIGRLNLIVIKLAEIAHIALYLGGICNGDLVRDLYTLYLFHCADNVGQLTHAGGFDDDPVRGILR